jgi:hypothetical protein
MPVILSVALAVLATAFHIRSSLDAGTLSLPPGFDDVAYFVDAALRLERLREGGLPAFLLDYKANPPHSPLSTLFALVGFSFLGVSPWAACAAMVIPLAVLLYTFFAIASDLPRWLSILLCVALLGSPIVGILILDFRPDAFCSLATACGAALIVLRPWSDGDSRTCVLAALLFSLALWSKPALFPVTLLVFGCAMIVASIPKILSRTERPALIRAFFATTILTALLVLPHYAVAFDRILDYFVSNYFAERWQTNISFWNHVSYYIIGPGGQMSLGAWVYLAVVMALFSLVIVLRRRDRRAFHDHLRIFIVILITYGTVSLTTYKTAFIGIAVSALLMVAIGLLSIDISRYLVGFRTKWAACAFSILFLAFSISTFGDHWTRPGRELLDPTETNHRQKMLKEVVETLIHQQLPGAILLEPVHSQFFHSTTINFALLQRRLKPIRAVGYTFQPSPDVYRAAKRQADVAIAYAPDAHVISWLPSSQLREQFLSDLRTDRDWILVRTIEDRKPWGPIYLFKRVK